MKCLASLKICFCQNESAKNSIPQELNVCHNKVKELEEVFLICKLPCLENLDLTNNKVRLLMPCLENLDLTNNKVGLLLPCLENMDLTNNKVGQLLPCLENLD